MKSYLFFCILAALFVQSCRSRQQPATAETAAPAAGPVMKDLSASRDIRLLLCQDWEDKEDAEDAAATGGEGALELTYRGLCLFADSTLVENPRDEIAFGKWTFNEKDKLIRINREKGKAGLYKILAIGPTEMVLMNMQDHKRTTYRADARSHESAVADPFYGANNRWRSRPLHAESDTAIRRRIAGCLLFYRKFLEDNAARDAASISFTGLPTCFRWYRGGISVINENKLEPKWISCFYNKMQAIKGQQMLEQVIGKKYRWDKQEKQWVKQSAGVLQQMLDTLKAL
jgi:hypothetical protein